MRFAKGASLGSYEVITNTRAGIEAGTPAP
jgi:hypothetical protein